MGGQRFRLAEGGHIDRSEPLSFSFDGRAYQGYRGDTLASALLANGVRLVGRSFKYHRPRGVYTAGSEEPNALVTLGQGTPNIPATCVPLAQGLVARSQNRWPSLAFDLMAVNSLLKPLFPAGFYYKTFMWPRRAWVRLYEPAIRRAAGLGELVRDGDPDRYERAHAHADVLVIGAGPAGLMAARAAAEAGARVILADEGAAPGGHLLGETFVVDGGSAAGWADSVAAQLGQMENVRLMPRTSVFGRYDGGTYGAVEQVADSVDDGHLPRQRSWTFHAETAVVATGAIERPLVFAGNDLPGVMLAGAARRYLNAYAVLPGRRVTVFTNNDDAYATARDLAGTGAEVTLVDARPETQAAGRALLPPAVRTHFEHAVVQAAGGTRLKRVRVAPIGDGATPWAGAEQPCDLLCVSGGWNPALHLLSHLGARAHYTADIAGYVLPDGGASVWSAGGARGTFDLQAVFREGWDAGCAAAESCGFKVSETAPLPEVEDQPAYGVTPLWRLPKELSKTGTAFVDLQNDVTVSDLELAAREGFGHAEHAKRYTTLGMATDQGKLANVNALGILAELQGRDLGETGTTTFRPLYSAASLGALAGHSRGADLRPTRKSAMHAWHEANGAVFTHAGAWLRPYYYPQGQEDFAAAVRREVDAVRTGVGVVDISTLGKIELQGPDAARFLDRLYINGWSALAEHRARYGVMLREDGIVLDDGTTTRLAGDRYFMTVTTANAARVLQHMEHAHQVLWPELDVQFCSVTEHWAAMAVAGPNARALLAPLVDGLDLSHAAFPPMQAGDGTIAGAPARIIRLSFSGELAYEIYVPAAHGQAVWEAVIAAGAAPYGTEAMTVMRTEKGHVAGPELDGRTMAHDLGLGRMMSGKKDFIGRALAKRSVLQDPDRLRLVGLKPAAGDAPIAMGAHLVADPDARGPEVSEGHVTTSVYSPTLGHFIALALLKRGPERHGERLIASFPLRHETVEVEVVDPVFVDPDGERMRV